METAGICFNSSSFYTIIVIVVFIFILTIFSINEEKNYYERKYNELNKTSQYYITTLEKQNEQQRQQRQQQQQEQQQQQQDESGPFRQDIYNQTSQTQSTQNSIKINQNTRGEYTNWHQVGILSPKNSTNNETIMALYGRRLHSDNWEYYTTHHINTDVKIPLENIKKELYDGDSVSITGYQDQFVVEIYDLDAPKYIPYI